nr:MAG TPA: hypothetical protein [Bacteriophage sp.]
MALVKILLSHPLRLPTVGTSPYYKGRDVFSFISHTRPCITFYEDLFIGERNAFD